MNATPPRFPPGSLSCACLVLFLTCFSTPLSAADGAPPVRQDLVRLLSAEGIVEVAALGTQEWKPAHAGQLLQPGDKLRTGRNSRATLYSAATGMVRVSEQGLAVITAPREAGRSAFLDLLRGLFYFFLRGQPAEVDLRNRLASAATRGTEFQVAVSEDGRMEIAVFDGVVDLRNEQGQVTLTNGQRGVAMPGQVLVQTAALPAVNVIQWCLYYPAVLDVEELGLPADDVETLRDSLAAWRAGDLLAAVHLYPAAREPRSAAERVYVAALRLTAGETAEAQALAEASAEAGPLAEALRQLVAAAQFRPFDRQQPPRLATEWLAESYYQQSRASVERGALERALEAARKARERAPRCGLAWARLAEMEFSFGRAAAAKAALEEALRLSPQHAQAMALRGFVLAAENRIGEARRAFDAAIALDGALGNAWLGRGLCRIRQGETQAGRADLLVAAGLEPQRALLRSYLGKTFGDSWEEARAAHELDLARNLDPNDPTPGLYGALLRQQQNRFNDAIRELEASRALNDNRSLFRSELLLDQDRAVRSANLARIYQDAGMTDWSVTAAGRAVNEDYANYSAHLFLASSYNALRDPNQINLRYETPTFVEYLLGNLLSPASAGVLSPAISQQEYSPLLERNRLGVVSTPEYQSRGAWMESGSQFGVFDRTSYALDGYYRFDPGFRPNNDAEQTQVSAQIKQQLTPQDTLWGLALGYWGEGGDVYQYYDPARANPALRTRETQEPLLALGYRHEWGPGSHTLFLGGRLQDTYRVSNPQAQILVVGESGGNLEGVDPRESLEQSYRSENVTYSAEAQQLWQRGRGTLVFGARYQQGQVETRERLDLSTFSPYFPDAPVTVTDQSFEDLVERVSGYGYYLWQVVDPLQLIGGLSYDWLSFPRNVRSAPVTEGQEEADLVAPKAGFIWTPFTRTTVRGAFTRSLSGASLEQSFQIEPSQVAGFNQLYRSLIPESVAGANSGAENETWGLSLEQKLDTGTYLSAAGAVLYSEVDRLTGVFVSDVGVSDYAFPGTTPERLDFRERSLLVTADQLVGRDLVLGARYRLTEAEWNDEFPELTAPGINLNGFNPDREETSVLHQVDLHAHFNHPSGFFGQFQALWTTQSNQGYSPDQPGDDFWQFNVFAGYRSSRRHWNVTVGLLNLAGTDYRLSPLTLYQELPRERTLLLRLNLRF